MFYQKECKVNIDNCPPYQPYIILLKNGIPIAQ